MAIAKKKNTAIANLPEAESLEVSVDKILEIREACKKYNLGIDRYAQTIDESLRAMKSTAMKDGSVIEEVDVDKRLRAALIGLELEGYIRAKAGGIDNSKHTHVTYQWLNGPTVVQEMSKR